MPTIVHAQHLFAARAAVASNDPEAAVLASLRDAWSDTPAIRIAARLTLERYGVTVSDDPDMADQGGVRFIPMPAGVA